MCFCKKEDTFLFCLVVWVCCFFVVVGWGFRFFVGLLGLFIYILCFLKFVVLFMVLFSCLFVFNLFLCTWFCLFW